MGEHGDETGRDNSGDVKDDETRGGDKGDNDDNSHDDFGNQGDKDTPMDHQGSGDSDGGLTRTELGQSFRENALSRDFGFPEFRDLGAGGGFNRDGDIRASKDLVAGLWEFTTGQDSNAEGAVDAVTGLPSAKEFAIGFAVGVGVFFIGPELFVGGEVLEASEAILGTNPIQGVEDFSAAVMSSAEIGAITTEAIGKYNSVKTRVEGFFKMNEAGQQLKSSRASSDYVPGESRSTQREIQP